MGSHRSGSQQTGQDAQRPRIRVNSDRVAPLDKNQMVEAQPPSKFSQWREQTKRAPKKKQEQNEAAPVTPIKSGRRRAFTGSRWKKWGVALATLAVLALLFIGVVFYSPLLATRTITVEGASLLQKSAVEDRLSPLEGRPLTRITDQEVADLVGEPNKLRGISVEARPPHDLVVTLQERIPVAVVKNGSSYELVDAEGQQLGSVDSVESAGLPLVDGGTGILGSQEFNTISAVLEALPADLLSQVKEAKADSASTIALTMQDDTRVVWGTAEDSELKAKVLAQLRSSVGKDGAVSTYDVSSPMVPTTK
ncbi:cell division protein FtsQ/DivIB [Rothia aerolata]|uniref:Cell division protein FtsQ n=1 Tax=Rothia aerolata TaxID=1812262 RepID=A0A917IKT6_9MICC|nr:cell division protein FtsQ/DivIB [Rothia aerolata]GGH56488.1 cell division protein FtsQ [Rothia aerolata]